MSYLDEITHILQTNCPNEACTNFIVIYREAFEKKNKFKIHQKRTMDDYWSTNFFRNQIKIKPKAGKKSLKEII